MPDEIDRRYAMMATRVQCIRQMHEPIIDLAAAAMRIEPHIWYDYETGALRLPLPVAADFAVRFNVSLDFLWFGRAIGIVPGVLRLLREDHPELLSGLPEW